MTDAQELNTTRRDTLLTARKRAKTITSTNFLGYITDANGDYFVDANGDRIYDVSAVEAPAYTVVSRDTLLTRKDREG